MPPTASTTNNVRNAHASENPDHPYHIIIQTRDNVRREELRQLEDKGVTVMQYIGGNEYFCRTDSEDEDALRALFSTLRALPFVVRVVVHHGPGRRGIRR